MDHVVQTQHVCLRVLRPSCVEHHGPAVRSPLSRTAARALRLAAVAFCAAYGGVAHAETYYVDAYTGNDGNPGTSSATPFRTISKVNSTVLHPGDSILLKRGQVWREQLTIVYSGQAGSPITIGAYGNGAAPVLSGAADMVRSSWSIYSNKIYVTTLTGTTAPAHIYVDGDYYNLARYPDTGFIVGVSTPADSKRILTAVTLNIPASDAVGSWIMAKTTSWLIGPAAEIESFNPTTHVLTTKTDFSAYPMKLGFGFYLQNKLWMLNVAKEWYYDSATKKLYLWTAQGDSPAAHTVELSSRPYGILIHGKSYINIAGVRAEKASVANIEFAGGSNINLDGIEVFGGTAGIRIGTSSSSIKNSSIRNATTEGIETAIPNLTDIKVTNNTFNNNGNVGTDPVLSRGSLLISGNNVEIRNNTITNSGYIGIRGEGDNVVIDSNTVDYACIVLDDCGGIYTYGTGGSVQNITISNNKITNMIGNKSGTPNQNLATRGIYLDTCPFNVNVFGNKISNADYGIHIHNGHDNRVTDNEFFARRFAIIINEDGLTCGTSYNNVALRNTYSSQLTNDSIVYYYTKLSPSTEAFGSYDYNKYCPVGSQRAVNDQGIRDYLPDWQQKTGQDLHSTLASGCTPTP